MLLKKQTVWLLTMLSLVIVLSVYYVTTPPKKTDDMATTVQNEEKQDKETKATSKEEANPKTTSNDVVPIAGDEAFESARMEISDQRNKLTEDLTKVMSNTELSAEERKEASDAIGEIRNTNSLEAMIETFIVSMEDYEAALVQVDKGKIKVTVKAKDLSESAANDIVRLVSQEVPNTQDVTVELQPKE